MCDLLIGCAPAPEPPPRPTPFQTDIPLVEAQALPIAQLPAAQSVRTLLAQQLQTDPLAVEIIRAEETVWRDTCLGLPAENRPCTESETPGYLITAAVSGDSFVYRTDAVGAQVRLVEAPDVNEQAVAVEWQAQTQRGCWHASISIGTVAFGACGADIMPASYADPTRVDELQAFVAAYPSFNAETAAGTVRFVGIGTQTATDIEQRMIAEWAQAVAREAESGQAQPGVGAALVYARVNADEDMESLQIYRSGEALATVCEDDGDDCREPVRARLTPGDLLILYDLVDTYQSFDVGLNASLPPYWMVFTGDGLETAPPTEQRLIQAYAQEIFDTVYQGEN